jgi:hypothetical protein
MYQKLDVTIFYFCWLKHKKIVLFSFGSDTIYYTEILHKIIQVSLFHFTDYVR